MTLVKTIIATTEQTACYKKIKFEKTNTCKDIHSEQIYVREDRISSRNVTIDI